MPQQCHINCYSTVIQHILYSMKSMIVIFPNMPLKMFLSLNHYITPSNFGTDLISGMTSHRLTLACTDVLMFLV